MARLVLHQLWLCAAIAVVLLGKVVRAADEADDDNKFLYPPKNSTFHYLDTINVAFKTDYDEPWLYLYCWDSNDARQEILFYSPSALTGKSSQSVQLTSNTEFTGTTCWFKLAPESQSTTSDDGINSPEFSYVKKKADEKTFGLSTTSSASSTTSRTPTATSTSSDAVVSTTLASAGEPTVSATESAAPGDETGLSTGAQAGIGVAVGVVGLGGIIAGVMFWLRRRKQAADPHSKRAELHDPSSGSDPESMTHKCMNSSSYSAHGTAANGWSPVDVSPNSPANGDGQWTGAKNPQELHSTQIQEIYTTEVHEMPGHHHNAHAGELEGDSMRNGNRM